MEKDLILYKLRKYQRKLALNPGNIIYQKKVQQYEYMSGGFNFPWTKKPKPNSQPTIWSPPTSKYNIPYNEVKHNFEEKEAFGHRINSAIPFYNKILNYHKVTSDDINYYGQILIPIEKLSINQKLLDYFKNTYVYIFKIDNNDIFISFIINNNHNDNDIIGIHMYKLENNDKTEKNKIKYIKILQINTILTSNKDKFQINSIKSKYYNDEKKHKILINFFKSDYLADLVELYNYKYIYYEHQLGGKYTKTITNLYDKKT